MADLKIRAEAWSFANLLNGLGADLHDMEPAADGWHTSESLISAVQGAVRARKAAEGAVVSQVPSSMTVDEAYRTGRVTDADRGDWAARFAADPLGTGRVLAGLTGAPWTAARNSGDRSAVSAWLASRLVDDGGSLTEAELASLFGPGR